MGVVADCLFCKIVAGDVPATVVHRTPSTLAVLDINPQARVHVLVMPVDHHEDALALATGKFARTAICEFPGGKANEVEHFFDACGGASGFPFFQNGNESHIFRNRKMREETGVLDNVTNASAETDQIPSAGRALLDEDFPLRGHQHSIDQAKKCGLSATAAAEEDERLTLRNG